MNLSLFVTSDYVMQVGQTWDKHGVLTPEAYLLLQKGSK